MVAYAAEEQVDEKGYAKYRNSYVDWREVGACDTGVEAPEGPNPDEKDYASLPRLQPVEAECSDG